MAKVMYEFVRGYHQVSPNFNYLSYVCTYIFGKDAGEQGEV